MGENYSPIRINVAHGRAGSVNNKTSTLLMFSGMIVISIAILNFYINIPDYFANLQVEHSLSNNSQAITSNQNNSQIISVGSTPIPGAVPTVEKWVTGTPNTASTPSSTVDIIDGYIPDRIIIPAIQLDAPVVQSEKTSIELRNQWFEQWTVPNEFAAGWQANSAPLGMVGNTILGGHHNEYGKVFEHLVELNIGDLIYVYSGEVAFVYRVTDKLLLPERDVSLEIRKANAEWIASTGDERLTLVTCWPKRSNTHRVIIVAIPVDNSQSASSGQIKS
jgi:LPXTG-site transpeptidase (sortase) family protein